MPRAEASRRRCAIYTRKSSEEGLEQEFNSLAAQREACEAFIRSQRNDLSGMRDAAALARCTLAALIAQRNDPPNGPDLIAWQQFVLVCPRQARAGYRRRGREQSSWQYWPA